ncbi:MAG: hypothetical protein VX966_03320 [Chloroflexota bacterium]|nr:hypothetical protein [Chloroflexota bacterium]
MPAYPLHIRSYARRLWEAGNKPQEVRSTIRSSYAVKLGDATLRRWASDDNWSDWKEARKTRSAEFAGSQDPTVHLCEVLARRAVREHSYTRTARSLTRSDALLITKDVLEEVVHNYEPDSLIINHLKEMVMDYIYAYRSNPTSAYSSEPNPEASNQISSNSELDDINIEPLADGKSIRFAGSPEFSDQYLFALSEGRKILEQMDERLKNMDQRLEQIKSIMSLFNEMEKRMNEFLREIETAGQYNLELAKSRENYEYETEDRPEEYRMPSDEQLLEMVQEEERLQKLLGIWNEPDEEESDWVNKPWLNDDENIK